MWTKETKQLKRKDKRKSTLYRIWIRERKKRKRNLLVRTTVRLEKRVYIPEILLQVTLLQIMQIKLFDDIVKDSVKHEVTTTMTTIHWTTKEGSKKRRMWMRRQTSQNGKDNRTRQWYAVKGASSSNNM